jgi:hypothetical protein
MRKLLFALLGLLLSAPFWGQEIVVFKDYRSLVIQSHRVQGDWTYLHVGGGELAILSKGILEIRQESSEARTVPAPSPSPVPAGPAAQRPSGPQASAAPMTPPMPFRPPAPGMTTQNANDDDENGSDSDDEGDDEGAPKPMQPPSPIKPPPPNSGAIVRPNPLAPAQGIVQNK